MLHVRHLGFHSVIANRVVYTVEEPRGVAFGHGTLTGHAEQGEERFQVTMDDTGAVAFGLSAFSRPRLRCHGRARPSCGRSSGGQPWRTARRCGGP